MLEVIKEIPLGIYKSESGGGGEVNNQNKTITENGVYTADAGYTGLGTVTVDVPSSGQTKDYYANFRVHGYVEADVDTGLVSMFGQNISGIGEFLELPQTFNPAGAWEFVTKVYNNPQGTRFGTIIAGGNANSYPQNDGLLMGFYGNILRLYLSSNNTSWDISQQSISLEGYTWYWLKLKYDGSSYTLDYSTDGETYINGVTIGNVNKVTAFTGRPIIGSSADGALYGFIDLSETYLKDGDTVFWTPKINLPTVYNKAYINHKTADRHLAYVNYATGELGNFSSTSRGNFYACYQAANKYVAWQDVLSFKIGFHFKTGSTINPDARVMNIDGGSDSPYGPFIGTYNGAHLTFYDGSSYIDFRAITGALSPDTDYWVKWEYDRQRNTVKSYYSTDGENYSLNAEDTPGYSLLFGYNSYALGGRTEDSVPCVFDGQIFLADCYMIVNGHEML